LLLRLPAIVRPPQPTDESSMVQKLRGGLHEVGGNRILRSALVMMAAGYFAMFFYDTLIAPLTRDLGFSQTVLGLLLAAVGGGGVAGALAQGFTKRAMRPFAWMACGSLIGAALVILLGWFEVAGMTINLATYLSIFAILGLSSAMAVVPFRTIVHNLVPPDRIGRIASPCASCATRA
jgi:predicted MFS family arabinose efflux permease